MVPQKDPLGILGEQPKEKRQADPLGILKKKEDSEPGLETGGGAGISEVPLPKDKRLTYNDLENLFVSVNEADKKLSALQAGKKFGPSAAAIPQRDIDIATKNLSQTQKRKEETLINYQKELDAPVKRLLDTGEYNLFFDGEVFNKGKAREHFGKITEKYGGGSYLIDSWASRLEKEGRFKKDQPRYEKLFDEEIKKEKIDFNKYGKQVFEKLAKNQYDNINLIKKDANEEASAAEVRAKQEIKTSTESFNNYVEDLNKELLAGRINPDQAASMYDEALKNLNSGVKAVNDNYLDLIRNINTRVNKKYGRIEGELKRIGQTISQADILKEMPESDRVKIKNATERAASRLSAEKNDIKKAALAASTSGLAGSLPGATEWATNLSNSILSGFNSGLANLGDFLHLSGVDNKVTEFLRGRSYQAEQYAPPKYEWNKDEWLNRAITSTGTSLGASAPALLPTIGIGLATGGAGIAPAIATGLTSFAVENAQNAGQQYQEKLLETGDPNVAAKSADKLFKDNTIALPFYFLGGLGDMTLLSAKSGGIKKYLTGIGLEQVEELPTEYIQSYNEAKSGGYKKSFTEFVKENPEIAYDTIISTVGQGAALGSIGDSMSSFSKNVPESRSQFFANMIQKKGPEFANAVLEKYYTKGVITKEEYEAQKAELEGLQQKLSKLEDVGVSGEEATLMASLDNQAKDLQLKIDAEQDTAVKAVLQKQLAGVNASISELAAGDLQFIVFNMPGGQGDTRVMTIKDFQALPENEANELLKNSDGISVRSDDDALIENLEERTRKLKIPENAPEGAYPIKTGQVAPEMVQYTMEAPKLAGEPEQISKPIELSIEPAAPEVPAAPAKSRVQDAIDKYDEGDISTINDLVDEIEAIADEEGNQVVLDAVEEYREEQRYNESLKGRGDMDAAEDAFLSKIRGVGEVALEAAPEVPAAPITKEEIKTEEYAIPEPSPTGVLQPTQERAGEERGGRRRMESPVERIAAAQKSKTEAAKKEIERRLTKYAAPTGKQSEVNKLVEELKVFNSQKRGRLGLKKIESLKKRNELILEAKRLGFETKVYKDGSIAVKGARAIDKTFSNYAIDDKFVPLDQRGEKLKNLFNRILGLADAYGYGFDFFIPNVIIGADGKKMSTKQISNAVRDLENGIPSKGASAVLNSLEAMAEKGEVEVRVGQAVETVDIEDYFNRLEKDIADRDMELALMQEAETLPEKDLVKWVEEMAEEQSFETEIYEPDTEEITGEGREEPKIKGEGKEVVSGTAGGVVPPTRGGAPTAAAGEEGERVSGIKKGLVSERILAQVDFEKIGDKELLEKGRQIIESGEVKPKALVDKILEEKSGVLSPAEVVALITYKADLDNKIEDLSEEIARKEAAGEDIGTLGVELKSLEVERDNFDMAAVITAQQQSMSFRLRRFILDRDFNLIVAINKYKRANNGVIPAEVEEVFKEVDSKIKEINKKLKEEEAKVYEKEGEEAAKNIVDDVQREQVEKVAKNRIEKARKKRASLLEKYRKGKGGGLTLSTGGLSSEGIEFVGELLATYIQEGIGNAELIIKKIIDNFRDIQGREPSDEVRKDIENIVNDELARPFMAEDGSLIVPDKFIRSLVSKGATTIEQMTDAAFAELEPQVPGLTKRQVRDAITKYGKKVNPRVDELTAQINQAKRIGRLISELEDLQKMSPSDFIIKYRKKKPSNTTEAEKVLRKQINVLKKELDIDAETRREERRIEKGIKDAEESLAEYQRRIDELDFSARERGLPETPELKKARQARDEKRKEYESLKRLRPSTRLDASKKAVRKKIEELQERLRTGNYSKAPKAKKPIDAELYILNAEKEALQERVAREQRKLEKTTVRDVLKEIANIPRTLVSGLFDMGAAFSQGVYRIYSNPILSAKAFTEGAKQFFSEKRHDQWLADLRSSPEFKLLKDDMKIAISDPDGKISEQEGVIIAKYANFLYNTIARAITFGYRPATKLIQSLNPILASQRAFDGYMNYIRVNSALKLAKALENDGYTPESNPEVFEQAGDFVNTTTGRASLGSLDKSAGWLSTVLFAPRKVAAELKLFTPYAFYYYAKMPVAVRKRALLNFGTFAMSVIASHTLLKAALDALRGDDEEEDREFWDSDSPNFMSFKIGNQRVSFLGGAKTTIVFMSRLLGDRFVDQFGRESKFGERFGKKINTKLDLVLRFGLGKLAPTPGVIRDIAEKPNYEDYDEIYQNVIMPIWLQDAKEMQKDNPAEMQALFHLLGFVGANVRTVNPDSMKDKIVFKEKVRGEEVKRNVDLTEDQVTDFQNIYNNELKKRLRLINTEINRAADDKERAKIVDAAREEARGAAQKKLEVKYKAEFRKFPEQEKEKEGKALQRAKEKMN